MTKPSCQQEQSKSKYLPTTSQSPLSNLKINVVGKEVIKSEKARREKSNQKLREWQELKQIKLELEESEAKANRAKVAIRNQQQV